MLNGQRALLQRLAAGKDLDNAVKLLPGGSVFHGVEGNQEIIYQRYF